MSVGEGTCCDGVVNEFSGFQEHRQLMGFSISIKMDDYELLKEHRSITCKTVEEEVEAEKQEERNHLLRLFVGWCVLRM